MGNELCLFLDFQILDKLFDHEITTSLNPSERKDHGPGDPTRCRPGKAEAATPADVWCLEKKEREKQMHREIGGTRTGVRGGGRCRWRGAELQRCAVLSPVVTSREPQGWTPKRALGYQDGRWLLGTSV